MSKLVLIDGYSLLNRAYFAMPKLTDKSGRHTGAVFGFVNILQKIVDDEKPDYIAVAMDERAPTFRHEFYAEYKGTRKPMDEELRSQIPLLKELLALMRIRTVSLTGYEADDVIGSLAKSVADSKNQVVIVSGDRDLLQLINEDVSMRLPRTVKGKSIVSIFHEKEVIEEFNVPPKGIIELKALMGDTSDNIPGVKGIGEKTAAKLLAEYPDIDSIYEHIDEIRPERVRKLLEADKEAAYLSKRLATIYCEVPIEISLDELVFSDYYENAAVYKRFQELGFKKQLERFKLSKEERSFHTELDMTYRLLQNTDEVSEVLVGLNEESLSLYPVVIEDELKGIIFGDENNSYVMDMEDFSKEEAFELIDNVVSGIYKLAVFELKRLAGFVLDSCRKDKLFLEGSSYTKEGILDLSLMAYIIDSNKGAEFTFLGTTLSMLLKTQLTSKEELFGKKKEEELIKKEKAAYYGYLSSLQKLMLKAGDIALQELKDTRMYELYREVELPLSLVLADMEYQGIETDRAVLAELSFDFDRKISELQSEIYTEAGEIFNINSPKQLGEILFEKLKLPSGKKTKTGYSTAVEVLDKLKETYPVVQRILDYRHYSKLKTTYADALPEYIKEDGRIHGTFHQTVTSTGRLSSVEPNLQNIPSREEDGRLLRKAFVASEGFVFLDADYSQIELRILAHMSQDERLISAYSQGEDIHKMTAAAVFKLPLDEVTDRHRSNAKAVNFGIIYGISAFGLSNDIDISMKEAKAFIENYFETFPNIKAFLDALVEKAKTKGYAETLFGRRRYVPELKSSNFMSRAFGERIAMNAPIQGTAADIIKKAMIRVHNRLKKEGLKSRLILQVHDELLVETAVDEEDKVKRILKEEMMGAMELSVPLLVDINRGKSWYEAK